MPWMSILLEYKKGKFKSSISSKEYDSDFFHDQISIKKIEYIFLEIVTNSLKFEPVTKDNIKMKYRKSM